MRIAIALVTLVGLAGVAAADKDKDKADALFRQGKKLMGEKRYADACQSFEQSFKLDPGIGVELNVAKCYEEWGKLATAYRAYEQAEDLAKQAHDSRVGSIHQIVEALDAQVPKLTIHLPKDADTDVLKVWIDGALIETKALGDVQIVDPGPHLLEYQVNSEKKKSKVIPVDRAGSSEVTLDVPPKVVKIEKPKVVAPVIVADPGRTQRYAGIGVGGAGIVMFAISSIIIVSAHGKYNTALAMHCGGMTNGCDSQGLRDTHDARHSANIATVVFLIGVGAVGGGVALYLTAPHASKTSGDEEHAIYLAPTLDANGAGIVLGGNL